MPNTTLNIHNFFKLRLNEQTETHQTAQILQRIATSIHVSNKNISKKMIRNQWRKYKKKLWLRRDK